MKRFFWLLTVLFLTAVLFLVYCNVLIAQQKDLSSTYARQYLDSRTADLGQYLKRSGKIQERLLRKLRRKEAKLARRLAAKDSALYREYLQQRLSYDSIARLQQDTAYLRRRFATRNSTLIDSLKKVQAFADKQAAAIGKAGTLAAKGGTGMPYTDELAKLQQQLGAQQGIDELIRQRTGSLEQLAGKVNVGGLQSIQKNVYYAQEKMKAWKKLASGPDEAEEEALEYLQGTEGFSDIFNGNSNAYGGLGNNATAEDLQRLGYQTKGQVSAMLQQKLGGNLSAVQQQMARQVHDYSEKLGDVTGKVNEARQAGNKLKHMEKPAFRKNPERGQPFWQRLEPHYNFQTTRATPDGLRPAMLELAATVAFRHSPRLSYGIGIGLSTGLGRNWQHIRFTYEGVSARAFADWKALYGFSLQAGYERVFRPSNRKYLPINNGNGDPSNPKSNDNLIKDMFGGQQEAAYIGVMKRYRINSKFNGTIMAGYNLLWKQHDMRSPWILRFGWQN